MKQKLRSETALKSLVREAQKAFSSVREAQSRVQTETRSVREVFTPAQEAQTGRSMVEMLGVLAIVGVLSIGAVAGYQYGVTKYQVNETMNELNLRAISCAHQMRGAVTAGMSLLTDEFGPQTELGYAAESYVSGDTGYFETALSGVPGRVCRGLLREYTTPIEIEVEGIQVTPGDEENSVCGDNQEEREMVFIYEKGLSALAKGAGSDSGSEEDEPFVSPCGENEYLDINTGECVLDENCADGQFWDSIKKACYTCPTKENPLVSDDFWGETSCSKCQNSVETANSGGERGYVCLYCPAPRVNCFGTCCAKGEVCVGNGVGSGTCQTPACTKDADCTDPALPLCDTETGQCFNGCRTNEDCSSGEFCNLDASTTGYSYTRAPKQGTCEAATIGWTNSLGYMNSSSFLNWWSAQNFCKAIGKSLLSDPSSRCTSAEWAAIRQNGRGNCVGWTMGNVGGIWGWTAKLRNSFGAYGVSMYTGNVLDGNYYDNTNYALCE